MGDTDLVQSGEYLRALLKRAGVTQTELADRLGIQQTSVSVWVRGKGRPEVDRIIAIAHALEMDPAELLLVWWPQFSNISDVTVPEVVLTADKVDGRLKLIATITEMTEEDADHLLELLEDLDKVRAVKGSPGRRSVERS